MEQRSGDVTLTKLGHSDVLAVLELIDASTRVRAASDVKSLLQSVRALLPTSGVVAAALASRKERIFDSQTFSYANLGFSEEWIAEYSREKYFWADATKRPEHFTTGMVTWSHAFRRARTRAEQRYARRARECGVYEGVTIGIHPADGPLTWFSFIGRGVERRGREEIILRYLTPHLHEAMCRASRMASPSAASDTPELSRREREVIRWITAGKTNWETSVILGISERTTKFHVRNIMTKLGASTRAHAVAVALARRLIPNDL